MLEVRGCLGTSPFGFKKRELKFPNYQLKPPIGVKVTTFFGGVLDLTLSSDWRLVSLDWECRL